jgi:hypothetical protein
VIVKYFRNPFIQVIRVDRTLLAEGSTIPNEDKEKIKNLLSKPFNPYIRRHSALTEKSTKSKNIYTILETSLLKVC